MILKYLEFIREAKGTSYTPPQPGSKSQLRRQAWFDRNPNPEATEVKIEDIPNFNVPQGIIDMMKDWPVIMKSPYSASFYSSKDVTFNHKPEGSYRVANHWNFVSRRDNKVHCRTDKPVENDTQWCIGVFDDRKKYYKILYCEDCPVDVKKKEDYAKRLKYLQDPETINKKRLFKEKSDNHEIFVDLDYKGREISGLLHKYSGNKITILKKDFNPEWDLTKQALYSNGELDRSSINKIVFTDKQGNKIEDPYENG
jgi:hypothetical protein